MKKYFLRFVILSAPLMLVACGEGWEMQRVDNVYPYGNLRTAGTGVAYVRVKLLPKKELKIEPVMDEISEVEIVPEAGSAVTETILDAEEIFTDAQVKGGKVGKVSAPQPEDHSLNGDIDFPLEGDDVEKTSNIEFPESRAEEYIAQVPKKIEADPVDLDDINPSSGITDLDGLGDMENIEVYEAKIVQPSQELLAPKNDFLDFPSDGQENLDEIYSDPLLAQ